MHGEQTMLSPPRGSRKLRDAQICFILYKHGAGHETRRDLLIYPTSTCAFVLWVTISNAFLSHVLLLAAAIYLYKNLPETDRFPNPGSSVRRRLHC
uniref:Uncharacterized protein n=1 Tax=Aegilops tauschii subsp. strangulata TaxID=200361 RepID=A0A453NCN5_AEGTS